MSGAALLAAAQDSVPTEPWEASPGVLGFLVFFGMALVLIPLIASMIRHMRRVEQNEERRTAQEKADEPAGRPEDEPTPTPDEPGSAPSP